MHVIIAGGGIGGLTAALCLHRAGIEVTVYEQARELRALGLGITRIRTSHRLLSFTQDVDKVHAHFVDATDNPVETVTADILIGADYKRLALQDRESLLRLAAKAISGG